jgi:UDP-N-acetylmuramoylalanine--D-glutamate ligase
VGTPAATEQGIVVVELSSFQLETCETLHPKAAAILNLTPDHLDRYPSMDAYGEAKLRIAQRMTDDDRLVINADDEWLMRHTTRRKTFSMKSRADAFVDGDELVVEGERYPWERTQLVGRHNQANALAALLLMRPLVTDEQARAGLESFRPLPHRMQFVAEKKGVRFYDDSKATNVDSVVAGLDGFPTPFILIAGGRDKGGSYAPLHAALQQNSCRAVVLIGEAAEKIDAALTGIEKIRAQSMDEAVARAASLAQKGDAVLLSPACSSYDMFDNYEHRGRVFKAAVEAL